MQSQEGGDGPLRLGQTFLEKYAIKAPLGRGGHAWVYHAHDGFMGTHVAIKVLHRPGGVTADMLRRGQAEAQIMNRLQHPHITKVIDAGVSPDGQLYIVMELLRGRSLRAVLAEHGRLEVHEVLELASQIAEGAHAAHLGGAIHRDLKPENVFVERQNRVKIVDFGIAKLIDAAAWTTEKNIILGTMLYMSPEQVQGKPLDPRSDIYSLGVTMFEALLGQHPIRLLVSDPDANAWAMTRAIVGRIPPMLDELDKTIPRSVASLVQRTMAKVPGQRFASMSDTARAIRSCLESHSSRVPSVESSFAARDLSGPDRQEAGLSLSGLPRPDDLRDTEPSSGPLFLGTVSSSTHGRSASATDAEHSSHDDAPTEQLGPQPLSMAGFISTRTAPGPTTVPPVITRQTEPRIFDARPFLTLVKLVVLGVSLGAAIAGGSHFVSRFSARHLNRDVARGAVAMPHVGNELAMSRPTDQPRNPPPLSMPASPSGKGTIPSSASASGPASVATVPSEVAATPLHSSTRPVRRAPDRPRRALSPADVDSKMPFFFEEASTSEVASASPPTRSPVPSQVFGGDRRTLAR